MRNFLRLAGNVDVMPLLTALTLQPHLWNQNTLRTDHAMSPHREVEDVWLRFDDLTEYKASGKIEHILDDREAVAYTGWQALPQARPIIFALMRQVEGLRLGRVMITKMAPGKRIYPHEDAGAQAAYYDRFHVTLQSFPGVVFCCGEEQLSPKTGDVFWFDNKKTHAVENNSADDRITMIVDIRS
jgi:hypothetical protein